MKSNGNGAPLADMIGDIERNNAALLKRQERENILAMDRENASIIRDRRKYALVQCGNALPAAVGEAPASAQRLTTEETDEMHAERTAARLARFGDKAGKHGALAACTRAMMLRIPRDRYLELTKISAEVGPRPTTLITELAIIASRCDPENWHAALTAFQEAVNGRATRR
jgi:hypothetical protein